MTPPPPATPRPTRTPRRRRPAPAFTLVELIVAISITSVMLLLVSRIFNETTKAINIGADTSQIVSNSRILSDQIFQDFGRMYVAKANPVKDGSRDEFTDQPGGFLVLIQQRNSGVRFPDPERPRQDPDDWLDVRDFNDDDDTTDPGERLDIRTDQVAFFAPADKSESITPASLARYDSDAFANSQRIWLGHVARANLDGSVPDALEPGLSPGPNNDFDPRLVSNLVLGRQGLLIIDDQSLIPDGQPAYNPITDNPNYGSNLTTNQFGEVGTNWNLNQRVDLRNVENTAGNNYDELWMAASDTLPLRDIQQSGSPFTHFFELGGDVGGQDGIYTTGTNTGANTLRPIPRTGVGTALNNAELPTDAYVRHALSWAFAESDRRLLTTQDLDYPFAPNAVGRNHTFFIPYVSDFAVDFAADITDDYAYADDPATRQENPAVPGTAIDLEDFVLLPWWDPRWATWRAYNPSIGDFNAGPGFEPDGLPDGRPDEYSYVDPTTGQRIVGIKWYNMAHDPSRPGGVNGNPINMVNPAIPIGQPFDRTRPAFWRLPFNTPRNPNFGAFTGADQLNGQYHTVPSNTGTIDYPPFVGYEGTPAIGAFTRTPTNILSPDPSDTLAPNIQARAVFVFGHTADYDLDGGGGATVIGDGTTPATAGFEAGSAKWWPYALRIRYRLHDGDGSYSSVGEIPTNIPTPANTGDDVFDPFPGKWFEQIVPVTHHDDHIPDF